MSEAAEPVVIVLEDSLDISVCEELQAKLRSALEATSPLVLDAQGVSRADAAALQLLTAFVRKVNEDHGEVSWRDPSRALRDAARLVDLDTHLGFPELPGEDPS